ncbi:MAG: carboxyl transferase domain-containing protein [Eubacteriales bacterium]
MSSNAPYVLAQKEQLLQGGKKEAVEAQHSAGKQTARERVNAIIDEATFVEIDVFASSRANEFNAEVPCEGLIAGFGTIDGRPVYIYSQDYTVMNGSVGKANGEKICKVMKMAAESGVPIIGVLDSAGARVGEGVDALDAFAKIFKMASSLKGIIPQVSLVLGPCIGACATAARISDVVLGANEISTMGAHSAYVYDAKEGNADGSGICSADFCSKVSGLIDAVYSDEKTCIAGLKDLLSYLPSSCCDVQFADCSDDLNRETPKFNNYLEGGFDVVDVIKQVADNGAFFELASEFAKSMVTGFARLNGKTLGVVANQAKESEGFLSRQGLEKAADFIDKCDLLGIPILSIVDNKGLRTSTCSEEKGIVRMSSKLAMAYAAASVPKVSLILNNAIGSGYSLMASKGLGADMVYSWPNAQIAAMDAVNSAQVVYAKEIAGSDDPVKARQEYAAKFAQYSANPINAAKSGLIDDIIDPTTTRPILVAAFEMLGFSSGCSCC